MTVVALLIAAVLGSGGWAAAEAVTRSSPEAFRWEAPTGCPDAGAVRLQLQQLLRESSASLDDIGVAGRVFLTDEGYALELTVAVHDQVESRRVEAVDCVLLSRAAALLVAVTVDAIATVAALELADAPDDDAAVGPDAVVPPAGLHRDTSRPVRIASVSASDGALDSATAADAPPRNSRWRHGIEGAVTGGLGVALVPDVTGGLEGMIGWRYGPVRVRAIGYHWFARTAQLQADAGVNAALSGGALRGCYAVERPRIDVPLCAGPDVAALHGAGLGDAVEPRPYADVWIALAAGTGLEVKPSRRFALVARAEAVVGLRSPAVHLEAGGESVEVFRVPPVGFRLVLGVSVHSR